MNKRGRILQSKAVRAWVAVPLTALIVLSPIALAVGLTRDPRWQDYRIPGAIGGVLLLVMVYWLLYVRRVERELREETNLLHILLDHVPDRVYIKDTEGRRTLSNEADWKAAGAAKMEDILGKTVFDIYPPGLASKYHADDQEILEKGEPIINREEPALDAEGKPIWTLATEVPLRDMDQNLIGLVGIIRDITAFKQAADARQAAEERYRKIFEELVEGIYQTAENGDLLAVNPALAHMFGYASAEEMIANKSAMEGHLYVDPARRSEFQALIEAAGEISAFESEMYRRDGEKFWVSEHGRVVTDEKGVVQYYEGTMVDITKRKRAEEALRSAQEKYEQANQETQRRQAVWIGQLEQRTHDMMLLNEMSGLIQCCPTVDEAYLVIEQQAKWLFPRESGALYILNPSRDLAEARAAWGPHFDDPPTFKQDECWALRRGKLHTVETAWAADPRIKEPLLFCNHVQEPMPEAFLCVPLIAQGETIGVLHLRRLRLAQAESSEPRGACYDEATRQLAQTVADTLALAISNLNLRDKLRQQSIRDALTGMFNRRYMEESLDREVARAARAGRPVGVIMLDIDHFKRFNDQFGHAAGDAILRELGTFFASQIREADIACRYGGEEFALIMPDAGLEVARLRAEKIREAVKRMEVQHAGRLLGPVTISLGLAEFPQHGPTGHMVVERADAAMYRAKQAGRDQVAIAA